MNSLPLFPPAATQPLLTSALVLAMLLASPGTSITNIALPVLGTAFSAPFAAVQMVVVAYLTGLTVAVVPAGRLTDRLGHRQAQLIGLALMAVGTLLLALGGVVTGVSGYLLAVMTLTPGYQLSQVANNSAVLANVAGNQHGTASGLLNLSRNLGLIAGAAGMGDTVCLGSG